MLDRQKVEAILVRRFPGASTATIAAAANAIMGLRDEWEEMLHQEGQFGDHDPNAAATPVISRERRRTTRLLPRLRSAAL